MTDSFPRQSARTRFFSLGAPRSFQVSRDGSTVAFLRSRGGTDPLTCLWVLDVATGNERLVADPEKLDGAGREESALEKARRERMRESANGIVAFATDRDFSVAAFALAGQLYLADLGISGTVCALPARTPATDPRPDPTGALVAYCCGGALRVVNVATGEDRALAEPADGTDEPGVVSYGLAEFLAAEEMDRDRGYWWSPDGSAVLAARVDESPVQRLYIADPANPAVPPAQVRYPAAGTNNAAVTAVIAAVNGDLVPVTWDTAAFPYLANACWVSGADESRPPLLVVQSRDQRELRLLSVDPATGQTEVIRADTDPGWVDIVVGVPAWTSGGKIVWTADAEGARRLVIGTPQEHAAGTAPAVTPANLQVRNVLDVDGEDVLFNGSTEDPADVGLWLAGPRGVSRLRPEPGVYSGRRAGGTTVIGVKRLTQDGKTVEVQRDDAASPAAAGTTTGSTTIGSTTRGTVAARIASHAERPQLPEPQPELIYVGRRNLRTAILLPSWHKPGSGRLPVLCDPYGGPHSQRVLASRSSYLTSQWLAEQGFAVVVADGRGTPGRGPAWDRAVLGDLATPALEDQVDALQAAAAQCSDLDLTRVGIRGWSFGGFLAALAVIRRPDVFHAGIAGAPVIDWQLYDTHYTERYLGRPAEQPDVYERSSLLADAARLSRPLMIIHGLADDNVVVAHSLRLSSALLAAGRPHTVLPLTGVTHMASQEEVAENMLLLQVDFLRSALRESAIAL